MATVALAPDELRLPRKFGAYLLFDKIGEGGMARIYLGRKKTDLGGERLVVVKQILPMLAASDEFCGLLVDEAKLSATLSHKNVVQVHDLGRERDGLYIAMEYVEGLDLRELLRYCSKNAVAMPVDFSIYIVLETLRALDYAHRKRDEDGNRLEVIHRDVSPSNVLLSVEGEVKLCDFGIARAIAMGAVLPEEAIQGKAGYMSPEAARGDALDQRADVFSAGIILFELLSGRRLYRGAPGAPNMLEQARAAQIPPLPDGGRPDEPRLAAIVGRALTVDPAERYESASAMLRDLEAYATEHGLVSNALRFGEFLQEHFGETIIAHRRESERLASEMEKAGSLPPPARASDSPPTGEAPAPISLPPAPKPPRPTPSAPPSAPPSSTAPSASSRPPPAAESSASNAPLILVMLLVVAALVALVLTR